MKSQKKLDWHPWYGVNIIHFEIWPKSTPKDPRNREKKFFLSQHAYKYDIFQSKYDRVAPKFHQNS